MKNFSIAFLVFISWFFTGVYFLDTSGELNRNSLFDTYEVEKRIEYLETESNTFQEDAEDDFKLDKELTKGIFPDSSLTGNNEKLIEKLQQRLQRNQLEIDQDRARLAQLNDIKGSNVVERRQPDITFRPKFFFKKLVKDQSAVEFLAIVERRLKTKPQARIEIIGYTDYTAAEIDNYEYALETAQSIREFLIKNLKLPENQVFAISKGEEDPLYPRDASLEKIQLNNRYEIIFK